MMGAVLGVEGGGMLWAGWVEGKSVPSSKQLTVSEWVLWLSEYKLCSS